MGIVWALIFLVIPISILVLAQRVPLAGKVGAIVICYAAGIALGTFKAVPAGAGVVQQNLQDLSILLALPLLFFSIDIKSWFRVAGRSLLSFMLMTIAVLVAATLGYLGFRHLLGPEAWKAAGMLIGCYTGGTLNLAAIGSALGVENNLYNAVNLADMLVCPFYLLLAVTVLQRILLLFLPAFEARGGGAASTGAALEQAAAAGEYADYRGFFAWRRLPGLAGALGLAVLIAGIGGGLSFLVPAGIRPLAAILAVSTLGLACSFLPAVRRIERTFQLGNYFIMVFILAVSSQADLGRLLGLAPGAIGLVGSMVFGSALIHFLLAAVFRIDADTTITTSIAGIFSPPFIPMVAAALKNREMLVTGVVTGLIGWVIGTYLGISYAYILRAMF